jgi:AraC family transcriptional regulator of adaptative response/methylated-DNA-[protein]-cysteine methyltransferase
VRKKRIARRPGLCHTAVVQQDPPFDDEQSRHYATVARAIAYLRAHSGRQPGLDELAAAVHLSPQHLQRVFTRWAGVSPKRFLQHLTKEDALRRLRGRASVLQTACDVGLSSTSRLHELIVSCEAATPGEVKAGGHGLDIGWGLGPSPFGRAFVAWTPRGVCQLDFVDEPHGEAPAPADATGGTAPAAALARLAAGWPQARIGRDDARAAGLLATIFPAVPAPGALHLVLRGTNFQIQVWQAMLRTRPGELLSYTDVARAIGAPAAQRAVGGALGANAIAWLIPCHRVIRDSGELSHYRWGPGRKLAMLGWEAARSAPGHVPARVKDAVADAAPAGGRSCSG